MANPILAQKDELIGTPKQFPEDYSRRVRKHFEDVLHMRYVPSHAFTMGEGETENGKSQKIDGGKLTGDLYTSVDRRVTVTGFYLSAYEVTNYEYRMFVEDIQARFGDDSAMKIMPDTGVWVNTHFNNMLLSERYYSHPAFDNYPVVGVNWYQANAYCAWLTEQFNAFLKEEGEPAAPSFRLPTEAEWEAAGRYSDELTTDETVYTERRFATENGLARSDKDLELQLNCGGTRDQTGYWVLSFYDDGYMQTAPRDAFSPNPLGLYHMSGNVAEWVYDVYRATGLSDIEDLSPLRKTYERVKETVNGTADTKVVKGGAWTDPLGALRSGLRQSIDPNTQSSRIGFRVAMIKPGSYTYQDK